MGRPLWFVAGAGVGAYAAARARRFADSLTAEGMRDRVHAWRAGARVFAEEVHTNRVERETELREQLGLRRLEGGRELETGGGTPRAAITEKENTHGHR